MESTGQGVRTRSVGTHGAIAVGGYIAPAGLRAAPVNGASMNTVRSLAPDLMRGDFLTTWIWVVGPFVGALIAVAFEWTLKGKPTAVGRIAAQGMLGFDDPAGPDTWVIRWRRFTRFIRDWQWECMTSISAVVICVAFVAFSQLLHKSNVWHAWPDIARRD
jgi:hypothetical protein